MKQNKVICIDVELIEQLKTIDCSASSLINNLLIDYFNKSKSIDESIKEKQQAIESVSNELKELEINKEKIDIIKAEQDKIFHNSREAYEDSDERWNKIAEIQREAFFDKKWDFGSYNRESMFKEYMSMLRTKRVPNLLSYLEFKGITERNGV